MNNLPELISFESRGIAVRDVPYAGWWSIGTGRALDVGVERRPSWIQRFLMGRLLGITWIEEPHTVRIVGG